MADNKNTNTNTKTAATVRKGRESYTFVKQQSRRNRRAEEANARQLEHDSLTVTEKVAKAKSRRGNSAKEITRLTAIKKAVKNLESVDEPEDGELHFGADEQVGELAGIAD